VEQTDAAPHGRRLVTVARLLESMGSTLLEPLHPTAALDREISGIALVEGADEAQLRAGDVVLCVGVEVARLPELLDHLERAGAAALVVKWHASPDERLRQDLTRRNVPVLGLNPAASWLQLAELVRTVISARDAWVEQGRPPVSTGEDLFALAETISAIVDGPVTIEDRLSRVLAFSGRQEEADAGRIETVLGRQVPDRWVAVLERRGVFRALARGRDPVYVDDLPDGAKPRVCVAVRAGDELLGSLWAAVDEPLSPARSAAFRDAANIVALHLLQLRVGQDIGRRLQADLVARVLDGVRRPPRRPAGCEWLPALIA